MPGGQGAETSAKDPCRTDYVIFEKKGVIRLYSDGRVNPIFVAREVKREGARVVLTGVGPGVGAENARLELVLGDAGIRFDDVRDKRGRSLRYDRFENAKARELGILSIGDVFRLVFDLKRCRA